MPVMTMRMCTYSIESFNHLVIGSLGSSIVECGVAGIIWILFLDLSSFLAFLFRTDDRQ
jgi:hypothetical protein